MVLVDTSRFYLRPLTLSDVSARYLGWLSDDQSRRFIQSARVDYDIQMLSAYVMEKIHKPDTMFLGIFERTSDAHIGNLKFEPVDKVERYAVLGILIGDPKWRGKRVAEEVIKASADWLKRSFGIREIILGVARENQAAIRAYARIGFREETTPRLTVRSPESVAMVWHLES